MRALDDFLRAHPQDFPCLATVVTTIGATLPTRADPYAPLFDPRNPGPDAQAHLRTLLLLQDVLCAHLPQQAAADTLRYADAAAVAPVMLHVASMLYRVGQWDAAERLLHRTLVLWAGCGATPPQEAATCWNNLGRIAEERGDIAQGIAWHRKALALRRQLLGQHHDTAFSCGNLGVALATDGQWAEAAALLQEATDMYARLGLSDTDDAKGAAANLAVCRQALSAA